MKALRFSITAALAASTLFGQSAKPVATHPDLSGTWSFTIDLPPTALKKEVNGKAEVVRYDRGVAVKKGSEYKGALPFTAKPEYKPEFQAKVKDLFDHESKTDPVFYCDQPGIPRIGPPRRIVQLPNEMIFLYEDIADNPFRVIPTDGRAHRKGANPSYYGNSVGHWEGNTLVIESIDFVEETWIHEDGGFHSDALKVTERLWKDGDNLVWQPIVEDPKVLAKSWTAPPRVVKPSTERIEEAPKCVEADGDKLTNNDHHQQR